MTNGPISYVGGVGGVGPQRIGTGKSIPSVVTRYLRRNEGSADGYEAGARLIPNPLVHFDIELTLLGDIDVGGTFFAQAISSTSALKELHVFQNFGSVSIICGGSQTFLTSPISTAGVYRLINDGVNYTLLRNGVLIDTVLANIGIVSEPVATTTIASRHNNSLGSYTFSYTGVIASAVVRNSLGGITNGYNINSNSNDITDDVGSDDAVVVGGNADDWGLFKERPTLWKGQDLTVPPWDSIDQELLK